MIYDLALERTNAWEARATNSTDATRNFGVYAVCLHNVPGAAAFGLSLGQHVYPGENRKGYAVGCQGEPGLVTGGGWRFEEPLDGRVWVTSSRLTDDKKGWNLYVTFIAEHPESTSVEIRPLCLIGTSGTTTRREERVSIPANEAGSVIATCEGGSLLVGGGFAGQEGDIRISNNSPTPDGGWKAAGLNTAGESRELTSYAVCLSLP